MATTQPATPPDRVTWGDRLRRLRLNRGMDQRHFAAELGVAKPTIGKYEMQRSTPRTHRLVENVVELRYGSAAADFLRGWAPESTVSRFRSRHLVAVPA